MVPNFHNPTGLTYTEENRKNVAAILSAYKIILIEDDPYGELRFSGRRIPSFYNRLPEKTILLGSFSKIVVPSFRLGWIVAPPSIMEKLVVAKQASDLHSNYFCQRVIHQYVTDYDLDEHIQKIIRVYERQKQAMVQAIEKYFPREVRFTKPEGGMFLWVTLPEKLSAMDLFNLAIEKKVAFVPGNPFYVRPQAPNTLRLNFSCTKEEIIVEGIRRLAEAIKSCL